MFEDLYFSVRTVDASGATVGSATSPLIYTIVVREAAAAVTVSATSSGSADCAIRGFTLTLPKQQPTAGR